MTELNESIVKRGPGRPPMHPEIRAEDPRERAKARAQEIMDHIGTIPDATDRMYIPQWAIPEEWSYEWKTFSIHNEEQTTHLNSLRDTGWEPVPTKRHTNDGSNIVPVNYKGDTIIRDGNILMERPLAVTLMMKQRDAREAKQRMDIASRVDQTKISGAFDMDNKGNPIGKGVRKSYSPMPVPD